MSQIPSPADFDKQADILHQTLALTPVHHWDSPLKTEVFGPKSRITFKLELLQKTGTFKARGATTVVQSLSNEERARGIIAGSGGNHGIAVAYAAQEAGVEAKIIVPRAINPFRLSRIKQFGAEVKFVDSIVQVLDTMKQVAIDEERTVIHPFENPLITLGAGTLGYELLEQTPDLDVVIVPIGGGGLASGVASAVKQISPKCMVYGVEPEGANSMQLSIKAGKAIKLPQAPKSIADSLSAPHAEPYSFSVCKRYLDDVVLISDMDMISAMKVLMEELKLLTEPAGAAATAALFGPLKEKCVGKNVGVITCGSNIDLATFNRHLEQ